MKKSFLLATLFWTLFIFGCGGSGGSGGGPTAIQMPVVSTLPSSTAVGVPPDSNVTISWETDVDCSSIDATTVISDSPGWSLASCTEDHAIFFASGQEYNTTYEVEVTNAVHSIEGVVAEAHVFTYTIAAAPPAWLPPDGGPFMFGTADTDISNYGVTDDNGNIYLVGSTGGGVLGEASLGGDDAFVVKLDPNGGVLWTTLLGDVGDDFANGIAVVGSLLYVVGDTTSALGNIVPDDVTGNNPIGAVDAFLAQLNAVDGSILWVRQFGTVQDEIAWSVAVDSVGDIIVSGVTSGTLAGGGADGDDDAFLAKFSDVSDTDGFEGTRLWVSQYGSDLTTEDAVSVVVGQDDLIYTAGETGEDDNNGDAYAAQNSPMDGSPLAIWKLGQMTGTDYANELVLDARGKIYVAGYTATDIDGDGVSNLGGDAFLAKIDPALDPAFDPALDPPEDDPLQWVEVLASAGEDQAFGLDVDRFGNLYVTGEAGGDLVDESNGWDGLGDVFVARFTLEGDRNWLDFLGLGVEAAGDEAGFDTFLGEQGTVFVTGPTTGDLDGIVDSNQGLEDAFIARYTSGGVLE